MNRGQVAAWVNAYERAWRTPGIQALETVFTPDATYLQGPYREPVVGLANIARMWEAERAGPDEVFDLTSEIVAVEGETAVVRVEVNYGDPLNQQFRDLWIIGFAGDARARSFEEWWFRPPEPPATTPRS